MHIRIHKFPWVHASAHTPSHTFMHTYATAEDHSSAACAAWLRLYSCFCDFPACNSYIFWETWDQTIRNPSVGTAGLELWKRVWRLEVSPDVDFQEPSSCLRHSFSGTWGLPIRLHWLARELQSPCPQHWDINMCHPTGLFLWVLGLGLHDVWPALYWQSYFPKAKIRDK